jgi:hypothetical protein
MRSRFVSFLVVSFFFCAWQPLTEMADADTSQRANSSSVAVRMELAKKQRKARGNRVLKRRNNLIKKADEFHMDFGFDVCLVLRKGIRTYVYSNPKQSWPPIVEEVVSHAASRRAETPGLQA